MGMGMAAEGGRATKKTQAAPAAAAAAEEQRCFAGKQWMLRSFVIHSDRVGRREREREECIQKKELYLQRPPSLLW